MKSPPKGRRKGKRSKQDGTKVIPRLIPTYVVADDPEPVKRRSAVKRKEAPAQLIKRTKPEQPKPKPKAEPEPLPLPLPFFSSWNPECISIVKKVLDSYPEGMVVSKETIWEDVKKLVIKGGKFQARKFGIHDYRVHINWILFELGYKTVQRG